MIKKILAALYSLFNNIFTHDIYKINIGKWFACGGDAKYILNHPLTDKSIVFDVGGYTGVFSDKIISHFNPEMYIFEPVEKYYTILVDKYANNPKVHVYKFGLSDNTQTVSINLLNDKTSVFGTSSSAEEVKLMDVNEFFQAHPEVKLVDLMSINIEGGEYALVTRLISTGLVNRINFIQMQFHTVVEDHLAQRSALIEKLKKTHNEKFSFPFVWDGFEKKGIN